MPKNKLESESKTKVIFNPHAGEKRRTMHQGKATSLDDMKFFFKKYRINADFYPTKYAGHATLLARESVKEGYAMVVAVGGDGTISEVANGLVGTSVLMGIIPLGTYMNTPHMLSIPADNLELAILLLKIKRVRKIDVGKITELNGEKLKEDFFYLENASVGFEALVQADLLDLERGNPLALFHLVKDFFSLYRFSVGLKLDDEEQVSTVTQVSISNGPYTGAALHLAPKAKLNDHLLTITLFKMTKWELLFFFIRLIFGKRKTFGKVEIKQAQKVQITSKHKRYVHADARKYGKTPVSFQILPDALSVVTGFPDEGDDALLGGNIFNQSTNK